MLYIKFTNGAVTRLINANNEVAQNDALENGFYMLTDSDGVPEAVDSQELIAGRDQNKAQMLAAIREKLEKKSTANKTNRTLYGRS